MNVLFVYFRNVSVLRRRSSAMNRVELGDRRGVLSTMATTRRPTSIDLRRRPRRARTTRHTSANRPDIVRRRPVRAPLERRQRSRSCWRRSPNGCSSWRTLGLPHHLVRFSSGMFLPVRSTARWRKKIRRATTTDVLEWRVNTTTSTNPAGARATISTSIRRPVSLPRRISPRDTF